MTIWDQVRLRCMSKNIPILAGIELTNACNLKCKYCYVDKEKRVAMDIHSIERLVDELSKLGTKLIVLSGGDIFMRPDIADIIKIIEKKHIMMVLYTNGTIPLKKHYSILQSPWIIRIELTVYGASSATYGRFCGNASAYYSLQDNLNLLKGINKKVLIKIVPTKYNINEIDVTRKQLEPFDFEININTLVIGNSPSCKACMLNDNELRNVVRIIELDDNLTDNDSALTYADTLCGAGKYSLCIDHLGNIKACFISSESAGNICTHSLSEIWNNSNYFLSRRALKRANRCDICSSRTYCFSCAELLMMEDDNIQTGNSELCRQARIRKEVMLHEAKEKVY